MTNNTEFRRGEVPGNYCFHWTQEFEDTVGGSAWRGGHHAIGSIWYVSPSFCTRVEGAESTDEAAIGADALNRIVEQRRLHQPRNRNFRKLVYSLIECGFARWSPPRWKLPSGVTCLRFGDAIILAIDHSFLSAATSMTQIEGPLQEIISQADLVIVPVKEDEIPKALTNQRKFTSVPADMKDEDVQDLFDELWEYYFD